MDIKNIISMYGTSADYYEMSSGRIFKFTESTYDTNTDKTTIPVTQDNVYIGNIIVDGKIKED